MRIWRRNYEWQCLLLGGVGEVLSVSRWKSGKVTDNQTLNISHLFLVMKRSGCLKSAGYVDTHTDMRGSIAMISAWVSYRCCVVLAWVRKGFSCLRMCRLKGSYTDIFGVLYVCRIRIGWMYQGKLPKKMQDLRWKNHAWQWQGW